MKMYVVVRIQFEGIHSWPSCNIEEVSFLKNPHRHIFHVECTAQVNHGDRDIEFIRFKRILDSQLKFLFPHFDLGSNSCEQIALKLMDVFPEICSVKVFEDNENGAEVVRE